MHLAFGHSRAKVYEFGIIRLLALGIGLGLFLGVLFRRLLSRGSRTDAFYSFNCDDTVTALSLCICLVV